MQLKGLVKFFTVALILICLYQLSFTLTVNSFESDMAKKATEWVKRNYPNIDKEQSKQLEEVQYKKLLDSSKSQKIGLFKIYTYQEAKDRELLLGLDLQGGMSVTMEVGLNTLIKSLANYPSDTAFNKALNQAVSEKANSGKDLVSLFVNNFEKNNPTGKLAPYFALKSNGAIKFTESNEKVKIYLDNQSQIAFENTYKILRTRIDKFGVSSPNINKNPAKGIINIELAGVTDPERVRRYLQSTANLQFFEVYTASSPELAKGIENAEKILAAQLDGNAATDTTKTVAIKDTTTTGIAQQSSPTRPSSRKLSEIAKEKPNNTKDITNQPTNQNSIARLLMVGEMHKPYQNSKNEIIYPASLAYVNIKDTGKLNSYLAMENVKNQFPSNLVFMYGKVSDKNGKVSNELLSLHALKTLDNGQAPLEGEHVTEAVQDFNGSNVIIRMNMDKEGTKIWGDLTSKNKNRPIAIVLDNIVYSAPNVQSEIMNGTSEISGSYSVKEAQDLAEILQTGKLPAPAKIVQEEIVGPTLGAAAVKGGAMAFIISFSIIFLLMLLYYNTAGWVANIALVLNILFTIGILASLGFTLTSAGIAGLVLTIGMAVDTNVIIFERIKEELFKGKSNAAAVSDGYKRSLAPIIDAHVTSFLTAAILFTFGLGPILGFATTQMIGIALSLFCGILVSRLITDIYAGAKGKQLKYFTNFSKKVFQHANFKFIEYRKITYLISGVILVLGIAAIFNGFDEGVEFAGGRSYVVKFDKAIDPSMVKNTLKTVFDGETPIIKTVGSDKQLDITTSYKIHENSHSIDSVVLEKLFLGLQNFLPQGTTLKTFTSQYLQSSQTVLPTISEELKMGAIKAAIIAIILICLYIFMRFNDWRYSLGTIVSLLHDVLVTLIVFSFFKNIVPFPLEIDQHFIAAILTVIGFSMNDTVIVYDRIREDSKLYPDMPKEALINKAINQTLSRTLMTSLTVFLTILILFIFGGEVTRGFAFAMLIGVFTGTYSSIFVAAPILMDIAKNKALGKKKTSLKPVSQQ